MKMQLISTRRLEIQRHAGCGPVPEDEILLDVLSCGVCRTDAKMWAQGHRDLILPRVPGHEIVAADGRGRRYVVWPGDICGQCRYCRSGRENLCPDISIIGFHRDGGFADQIIVPKASLIPVPETLDTTVACLAEPAGCVMHALANCRVKEGDRVLIYGCGTMGLITAVAVRERGADPMVIEINPDKIKSAEPILEAAEIPCVMEAEAEFEVVINACSDPMALQQGLKMLARGGVFGFFSGLSGDVALAIDAINPIHYRENAIIGAYGLNRSDMQNALSFIEKNQMILRYLVEATVGPEGFSGILENVLSGNRFKYILKINGF